VIPTTRAEWWAMKLAKNVARDSRNEALLVDAGWRVMILWECELQKGKDELAAKLMDFLGPPGPRSANLYRACPKGRPSAKASAVQDGET
jgi:hypothetical protein